MKQKNQSLFMTQNRRGCMLNSARNMLSASCPGPGFDPRTLGLAIHCSANCAAGTCIRWKILYLLVPRIQWWSVKSKYCTQVELSWVELVELSWVIKEFEKTAKNSGCIFAGDCNIYIPRPCNLFKSRQYIIQFSSNCIGSRVEKPWKHTSSCHDHDYTIANSTAAISRFPRLCPF